MVLASEAILARFIQLNLNRMYQFELNWKFFLKLFYFLFAIGWLYYNISREQEKSELETNEFNSKYPEMMAVSNVYNATVLSINPDLDNNEVKRRIIGRVVVILKTDTDSLQYCIDTHMCDSSETVRIEDFIQVGSVLNKEKGSNDLIVANVQEMNGERLVVSRVFHLKCEER